MDNKGRIFSCGLLTVLLCFLLFQQSIFTSIYNNTSQHTLNKPCLSINNAAPEDYNSYSIAEMVLENVETESETISSIIQSYNAYFFKYFYYQYFVHNNNIHLINPADNLDKHPIYLTCRNLRI